MKKIILTRGVPASGKTTWAESFVKDNPDYINLNRDDLRKMMFPSHYANGKYKPSRVREEAVSRAQEAAARSAIESGKSVVVSDTNLSQGTQSRWFELADSLGVEVEYKNFDVDLDVALERNAMRENGVPPKVIHDMYAKYVEQVRPEWKVEHEKSLKSAIIVDVDGTLADHTGIRSPFDWSSVSKDRPNEEIIDIVNRFHEDHHVIIMTGRDGVALEDTKRWLTSNYVPYDEIYIREAGDTRKDSIIKRELFDKHVRGKYNVRFVIDDRLQVIYMWRSLGLRVLDVAGGVF